MCGVGELGILGALQGLVGHRAPAYSVLLNRCGLPEVGLGGHQPHVGDLRAQLPDQRCSAWWWQRGEGGMRMGMLGCEPCDSVERGGSAETPKMGEAHTF